MSSSISKQTLDKIQVFLETDSLEAKQTSFGYEFVKGITSFSKNKKEVIKSHFLLKLPDNILYESVLLINDHIPIRKHIESYSEVVQNIGENPIEIISKFESPFLLFPGDSAYSVNGQRGLLYGYNVNKQGLLYVAKSLREEFVDGNSFRIPETSYNIQ